MSAARPFKGVRVVVTGASSGLGASLAEAFAAAGAQLVMFARSAPALEEVAQRCRQAGADPLVVVGDVTEADDCRRLVEEALRCHGGIDVMVACAGVGMWARFDQIADPAVLKRVMEVNYGGLVNTAHHALTPLKASRGLLVAISSVQGVIGVPYHTGYAASKHAVQGFCNSLRMELRDSGVEVLTVLAHWISGTRMREQALGHDGAPRGKSSHRHGSGAVPVEVMTAAILKAVRKRERALFVPVKLRYLSWLAAIAPRLADRIIIGKVEKEAAAK
jgi:short-subunit dehydrogenase